MSNLKKVILLIAGPGMLLLESVALFVHLFTSADARSWIIGGLVVFFLVFIPFYSIEYFRQEFKNNNDKRIHFKRKRGRTSWRGGNIHGKVPDESDKPGKLFKG